MTLEESIQKYPNKTAKEIAYLYFKKQRVTKLVSKADDKLKKFIKDFEFGYYSIIDDENGEEYLFKVKSKDKSKIGGHAIIKDNLNIEYIDEKYLYFKSLINMEIKPIDGDYFHSKFKELEDLTKYFNDEINKGVKIAFKPYKNILTKINFMLTNPDVIGKDIETSYNDYVSQINSVNITNAKENGNKIKVGTVLFKHNIISRITSIDYDYIEREGFYFTGHNIIYYPNYSDMLDDIVKGSVILTNVNFDVLKSKYEGFKL
jgi:hypothetical protein